MIVRLLLLPLLFSLLAHPVATARADSDPDLEPGFPVRALALSGTYHSGPIVLTMAANIDADPRLEIFMTSLAAGPLNVWHADGSRVAGWPEIPRGAAYPAAGNLIGRGDQLEIAVAYFADRFIAYDGGGVMLPRWPQNIRDNNDIPPSLADLDGDGIDEIIGQYAVYRADGVKLPNYMGVAHTAAVANIDADPGLEILFMMEPGYGSGVAGYDDDGQSLGGNFPLRFTSYVDGFVTVGDVDGDEQPEIVVVAEDRESPGADSGTYIRIYSGSGVFERKMRAQGVTHYGTAPALADLDGDRIPEIILLATNWLNVWRGDGSVFPGWPRLLGNQGYDANSAPVVGDVDGDGEQDIAATFRLNDGNGKVFLFDRNGNLHPRFPKLLPLGSGAVPTIADIDLDCRNELIIGGDSNVVAPDSTNDRLWVYDLRGNNYGGIEWGQLGGGAHHRGVYPVPGAPQPPVQTVGPYRVYLPIVPARSCR